MIATFIRRALFFVVLAAIAGGLVYAFWPKPVPADLAVIEAGVLEVTVDDDAVTRIRDIYTVSSPITGAVLRSPRDVGDIVHADETLLAVIEPVAPTLLDTRSRRELEAAASAAEAAVRLAEARVRQAGSALDFMESELVRIAELARRNVASQRDLEKARLDAATAEAELASAEATLEVRRRELESARARLIEPTATRSSEADADTCCVLLRAPVDGKVLRLMVESEQTVQAGTPLIEIGDTDDLEIVAELLSRDAVRVLPGAEARIDGWGGATSFNAVVDYVEPAAFTKVSALGIEEQRVRTVLRFVDGEAARTALGHDFRVIVRISVYRNEAAILVPLSALFRRGDAWAVFVVEEGVARLREIEIGERNIREAEVASGLEPGEQVILHAGDSVAEGVEIVARGDVE